MKKIIIFITLSISTLTFSQQQIEIVKGNVQSETSKSILQNVHVLNLTKVKGTITSSEGEFEIQAKVNDTLYFSYIGYKPLKVVVTNDLIRFDNNTIELTELAFALEEIIIKPYLLTGYLEIDVKNSPVNTSTRYRIIGLPNLGYEAGRRSRSGISKVIGLGIIATKGIKAGIITDFNQATDSIALAIKDCEKQSNERISDLSHKTITKVDTPIERGISVPNEVADEILSEFKIRFHNKKI